MIPQIHEELNYSNVFLIPKKTIVESRKDCDTSVQFGSRRFEMPIYPANMKSVVNEDTCLYFAKAGWFYTMHRFGVDSVKFTEYVKENDGRFVSISTGVNEDSYIDLKNLLERNYHPEYITLDIANAWCPKAERMIKFIKDHFPSTFLIVGNVASGEAVIDIEQWGADAVKAGIAGGKVCITKNKTGFHRPMISTVLDCVSAAKKPIIADGGITEHGDVAKALACGATMIMAGSLFAGFDESAGNVIELPDNRRYKEYFGSASEHNKGKYQNVEGKKILIDYKGPIQRLMKELQEDLQSSISYSGGNNISSLLTCTMIKSR